MNSVHVQRVGTSAVIVNPDKKVLFVKRSKHDEFLPGVWELPGGGTEFGEDPESTLIREVREECGLDVSINYPVFTFSYFKPDGGTQKHIIDIAYLCTLINDRCEVKLSSEHEEYRWMKLDEVELHTTDQLKERLMQLQYHLAFQTNE